MTSSALVMRSGAFDRAAIMRKAWRDFRHVRAAGDVRMTFGDWLRNAWRVARAQRLLHLSNQPLILLDTSAAKAVAKERRDPGCKGAAFFAFEPCGQKRVCIKPTA